MEAEDRGFLRLDELTLIECPGDEGFFAVTRDSDVYGRVGPVARAKRIYVTLVAGQMANVPWARCEMEDGRRVLVNLALAERAEEKAADATQQKGGK